jgi:hypothetical protein
MNISAGTIHMTNRGKESIHFDIVEYLKSSTMCESTDKKGSLAERSGYSYLKMRHRKKERERE